MSIGTVNGETRFQPFSRKMSYWWRVVKMPPIPLDITTPRRNGSTSGEPASSHASRAVINANCWVRSRRRSRWRSSFSDGSSARRPAKCTGSFSCHSSGREVMPDRPSSSADQVVATSPPRGLLAPRLVTTTLRLLMVDRPYRRNGRCAVVPRCAGGPGIVPDDTQRARRRLRRRRADGSAPLLLDVVDDVLNRLQVLELVVGDLHAELVLCGDGDLDHRQRVDVEVVHEALLRGDLGRGATGDLVDDFGETVQDLLFRVGHDRFLLTFSPAVRRSRTTTSVCCKR